MKKLNNIIVAVIIGLSFLACTPKQVVNSSAKQTENVTDKPINNISLVTLCMSPNRSEGYERELVGAFSNAGIGVMGTMDRFYTGPLMSKDDWKVYLSALKTDAIMITKIIPYQSKKRIFSMAEFAYNEGDVKVNSQLTKSPEGLFYESFFPTYNASRQNLSLENIKTVRIQTTLYSLDDFSTLWTSMSGFIKPKQLAKVRQQYAEETVQRYMNDMK